MILLELKFTEHADRPSEWRVDLPFGHVNLLVGKNATGKTRTLNVINSLAMLMSGDRKEITSTASWDVAFQSGNQRYSYALQIQDSVVVKEDLLIDGEPVLQRGPGGYGHIKAEDIEGRHVTIKFSVPGSQVAVFAKRDDVQHSFLKPIHDWANSLRHFRFGAEMSPQSLSIKINKDINIPVNEKDTNSIVPIFNKARTEFKEPYLAAIIEDMKAMGYSIEGIDIRQPTSLIINAILPGDLVGLSVRESEIHCFVDQPSMSQGMFRALSLLAQVNYVTMSKAEACILVDDIGDGLDFERSCVLIDLLRAKAVSSRLQLIMTSNNRFIMNRVPLEEWCILRRSGHQVTAKTYQTHRAAFDRFKVTGLNNFDILATDYLEKVQPNG